MIQQTLTDYTVVDSKLLTDCENAQVLAGLSDAYQASAVVASTAAATAATAATLVSAGVALQSIPVIGTIAGAIAIVAGVLAKVFGKRKARKAETSAINKQVTELKEVNNQIDVDREGIRNKMIGIQNQLLLLGHSDILSKNPIPSGLGSAKQDLQDAKDDFASINKKIDVKVKALEADQRTLQSWYDSLTGATRRDNIVLGIGVTAVAVTLLLLLSNAKNKNNG